MGLGCGGQLPLHAPLYSQKPRDFSSALRTRICARDIVKVGWFSILGLAWRDRQMGVEPAHPDPAAINH